MAPGDFRAGRCLEAAGARSLRHLQVPPGTIWRKLREVQYTLLPQSLASCIGFFYSTVLELHWQVGRAGGQKRLLMFPLQLLIVAVFDIMATIGFVKVELASKR